MDALIVQVRAQLEAERAAGPPQLESIEAEIAQAQTQVDKAQIAASQGKAQAKQLKREIDEWKFWGVSKPYLPKILV